jgi:hypothetical protein
VEINVCRKTHDTCSLDFNFGHGPSADAEMQAAKGSLLILCKDYDGRFEGRRHWVVNDFSLRIDQAHRKGAVACHP